MKEVKTYECLISKINIAIESSHTTRSHVSLQSQPNSNMIERSLLLDLILIREEGRYMRFMNMLLQGCNSVSRVDALDDISFESVIRTPLCISVDHVFRLSLRFFTTRGVLLTPARNEHADAIVEEIIKLYNAFIILYYK